MKQLKFIFTVAALSYLATFTFAASAKEAELGDDSRMRATSGVSVRMSDDGEDHDRDDDRRLRASGALMMSGRVSDDRLRERETKKKELEKKLKDMQKKRVEALQKALKKQQELQMKLQKQNALVEKLKSQTGTTLPKPKPPVQTGSTTPVKPPVQTGSTTPAPAPAPAPAAPVTKSATVNYSSPAGSDPIKFTVTVDANGVITAASSTTLTTNGTSKYYQDAFAAGVSAAVVGKKAAGLNIANVAGGSLTTAAFEKFVAANF